MHDINLIYSQYVVDKVLEERRDEAATWRRAEETATRAPLISRVIALLRAEVVEPAIKVAPKAEGARP